MLNLNHIFLLKDLRRLLLFLTAFTLPFYFQINSWTIGFLIIFSLTDLVIYYKHSKPKLEINLGLFLVVGIGYFIWMILGLGYSSNLPSGLKDIEQEASLLVFPIICYINRDVITKLFLYRLLTIFIAAVLILIITAEAIQIFLLIKENEPLIYLFRWRHSATRLVQFGTLSPNYFALYCVFISLVVLLSKAKTWAKVLVFTVFVFFIFHLVNRTGILAIGAIMLPTIWYTIYKNKKNRLVWIFPIIAMVSLLIFMAINPTWIKKKLIDRNFKGSGEFSEIVMDGRIARWGAVLNVVKENWIFGVGTGDVSDSFLQQYAKQNLKNDLENRYHAHNQFLQTWASNGLIGLFLFILPFIFGIILSMRKKNYFFLAFLLTFTLFSFTESTFRRQKGVVFYALFNSIFLVYTLKKEGET